MKRSGTTKCNICGLPGIVVYYEFDEEKGKRTRKSHRCHCLGHEGIHPSKWNRSMGSQKDEHGEGIRSLSYDDYQKLCVRRRRK